MSKYQNTEQKQCSYIHTSSTLGHVSLTNQSNTHIYSSSITNHSTACPGENGYCTGNDIAFWDNLVILHGLHFSG